MLQSLSEETDAARRLVDDGSTSSLRLDMSSLRLDMACAEMAARLRGVRLGFLETTLHGAQLRAHFLELAMRRDDAVGCLFKPAANGRIAVEMARVRQRQPAPWPACAKRAALVPEPYLPLFPRPTEALSGTTMSPF